MSRRDLITMADDEVRAFLDDQRVMTCATNGPRGWPHLMPLWFVVRDGDLWAWTFAKSQKVRNLERDARATVQVEAGVQYHELRGVMIEADVEVIRDVDAVAEIGMAIFARYAPPDAGDAGEEAKAAVRAQAAKRVALRFVQRRRATWDHRKLGGVY